MRDLAGFAAGLILGSFLNVVIHRLPLGMSVVRPRSRCPRCSAPIIWRDNIPVLSFVVLGGKCRTCRAPISIRYPAVELLSGAAVVSALKTWGVSAYGAAGGALLLAFLAVVFIDFEHRIIPHEITLPMRFIGPVFSGFFPAWIGASAGWESFLWSLAGLFLGGGILYLVGSVAEKILKKEAMGGGDVRFLAGIGAFLGWQGVLVTVFFSSLAGAVFGIVFKAIRRRDQIPYGPFIALGALIHLLWGENIITWYVDGMLRY